MIARAGFQYKKKLRKEEEGGSHPFCEQTTEKPTKKKIFCINKKKMTKRYVVNPKTNRAVDVEGCVGLKIINQLLKKGIQVKYQST